MNLEYENTINEIYSFRKAAIINNFSNIISKRSELLRINVIENVLNKIIPDYKKNKYIHIGGTCGKGSVSHYISSILSVKYKTGLLTSPHVFSATERLKINDNKISELEFVQFWNIAKPKIIQLAKKDSDYYLSFPEIVLIIGFLWFIKNKVEWIVVEVGVGGLKDQTNVIRPRVSAITNISLDHTHLLGNSIIEIAKEKSGIIKNNIPFFTTEQNTKIIKLLKSTCSIKNSEFNLIENKKNIFKLKLPGYHQQLNAQLAISIVNKIASINTDKIIEAIESTTVTGRFEEIIENIIIDIAHNEAAIKSLIEIIKNKYIYNEKLIFILGMAERKQYHKMINPVISYMESNNFAELILTKSSYRGVDSEILYNHFKDLLNNYSVNSVKSLKNRCFSFNDSKKALEYAKNKTKTDSGIIVVTGSTFLIDELFNKNITIKKLNRNFGKIDKIRG